MLLDGVRLTHPKGNPLTQREDDSRLIIGDTTDSWGGDHLDIDFKHISYDVDSAFAPIATSPVIDPRSFHNPESLELNPLLQGKLELLRKVEGQLFKDTRD